MDDAPSCRTARPDDHGPIIAVMPAWWGGRDLRHGLPRLFLEHFHDTSLIMERQGRMVGFLVGFMSQSHPDQAYAHFLGVDPALRGQGLGRALYRRFFDLCRERGRVAVRACTSPVNRASVAFHRSLGFSLVPGDAEIDGIPYLRDYNRPGDDKVEFLKRLE